MSNPDDQNSNAAAANARYAAYEKRKVEAAIAESREGFRRTQSFIATQGIAVQPVEHLVDMARRHGAHGFRGDPKKEIAADDGSDVLKLAAAVGLKGFTRQESNANDNRPSDDDDGSDVLASAAAVGLNGFEKQNSVLTDATEDDGSDVVALAQKHGLRSFEK